MGGCFSYVFNQIVSMLTLKRLTKTYDERPNYDLRRLLTGVDRLIDHLLDFSETEPAFTLGAIQCLPLALSDRDSISKAIKDACSKIKVCFRRTFEGYLLRIQRFRIWFLQFSWETTA